MKETTITVWALLFLFGTGAIAYNQTKDVVSTLNVLAWGFLIYMGIKLVVVILRIPKPWIYSAPEHSQIPETIDREHIPVYLDDARKPQEKIVASLVKAIFTKIAHAADEAAIHSFVQAKIATLRRSTQERYAGTICHINVIGFEGIIGTLIGLITFMAQATLLFQFPDIDPDKVNTSEFVSTITANLHKIDLWTVSTAFFTSVIGWGAKAWIGQWVETRAGEESSSITSVEMWIQDQILARMTLPAQVMTVLKFADLRELHDPQTALVHELKWLGKDLHELAGRFAAAIADANRAFGGISTELAPLLLEAVRRLATIKDLQFDVQYVEGGIRLVPHVEAGGPPKTRQEVRRR